MSNPLTTHVLDTSTGLPAVALALKLYRQGEDNADELLATAVTDDKGRVANLISAADWTTGTYRLRFFTNAYFAKSSTQCFYPHCDVTFFVEETESHYHIPLLLSPFGYSTYRGS